MSGSKKKSNSEMGSSSLADRLKNSLSCDEEKRDDDPRVLKLGSPVSTLRTRTSGLSSSTTRSTSGSSASVSGWNMSYSGPRKSVSSHSGSSSSTSPRVNILPAGNICPSGKVITGMHSKPVRTELASGDVIPGIYGHGSIMPAGATPKTRRVAGSASPESGGDASSSRNNPEELKIKGNENYKKGNFSEALNLYDKAIAISPGDAPLHCNRAAALIGLKRLGEAVRECEEAIRLCPSYVRAHQRLGSLLLRQMSNWMQDMC